MRRNVKKIFYIYISPNNNFQMDDIMVPLLDGSLEDTNEAESESDSMSTTQTYMMGSSIRVDYSSLSGALRDLQDADEIKPKTDKLQKTISNLQNTMDNIQAPNTTVVCIYIIYKMSILKNKFRQNYRNHAGESK